MNEAHLTADEKLFRRTVVQYPPRPLVYAKVFGAGLCGAAGMLMLVVFLGAMA